MKIIVFHATPSEIVVEVQAANGERRSCEITAEILWLMANEGTRARALTTQEAR